MGLCGALIIVRPDPTVSNIGNILVLGSAIAFALYQILNRKLAGVDPPETMIAYTALIATVVTSMAVWSVFQWPHSLWHLFLFIALGAIGALSQFLVIKAVQFAPASVVAPFQYTELLGATIAGYLVFASLPDHWTWAGAALIIAAGLYIAWRERILDR